MTDFAGLPLGAEPGLGALTLGGLLEESARRHGAREAVAFHDSDRATTRWTYTDLDDRARAVARALLAAGVDKGARVALLMGNRPEWVAAAFGIALAGGVVVPVNTFFEPPEIDHVLRHADIGLLVVQRRLLQHTYVEDLLTRIPELGDVPRGSELRSTAFPFLRRVVCVGLADPVGALQPWDEFVARGETVPEALAAAASDAVSPADPALIIYTSGTTALPKGILHPHRAPALQSWRFAQQLRLDPTARTWSAFPFFWSAGFVMIMGATLAAGGCLVLQEHFEPAGALRLLESERVTSPHAWPHQLAELEAHPRWEETDLSSIRQVEAFTSFGRHPSVHVGDVWSPRAAYGLSETCTIISSLPADTPASIREGNQGTILPGNVIRILEPGTTSALGPGEIGEIAVKGPTLMSGYVKTVPEACFDRDGFFHTGDAGFVDDAGLLHWTGRMTDMIKTGGANVSPVEIETALLYHPDLKAAVVIGVPHETLGEVVVVCVVRHAGATVDQEGVRQFLKGRVAAYKIPRHVVFVSETDLSTTGSAKIRVEGLRALASARLAANPSARMRA